MRMGWIFSHFIQLEENCGENSLVGVDILPAMERWFNFQPPKNFPMNVLFIFFLMVT